MQAEERSFSDIGSNSEAEKIVSSDENSCVVASTSGPVTLQKPVKRPTRQWAAWTREEEESFFTALRHVGKNFEKITSRVKSKNKDQVRHYYYRLVRRMNKLLGPTLCLDAKNSKDTNAAMLRWWSLLEKYSCKASKLHLKPRRFKIFVETLEHQLLKDRKKTVRKRTQGENTSPTPTAAPNQSKPSASDSQPVKMVLVDSQNIQKLGPAKPSFKRNVNVGINRSNSKGESTSMKQARRRKPGATSSTAYKKWEKAAIAGVSLVADAAEHVEREAADKDVGTGQGQKCPASVAGGLPPLPPLSRNHVGGSDLQTCVKLKLQLFPIDYNTRKALEMDKHNPHLELTLSTRKKISSVLEHINRKWGSSSVASGELMLFPDSVQRENLMCSRRWSQDSTASAADVYAVIGSPPVFRLRYGWFPSTEAASAPGFGPFAQPPSVVEEHADPLPSVNENQVPIPPPANVIGHNDSSTVNPNRRFEGPCDTDVSMSCYAKQPGDANIRQNEGDGSSIGEWADSLMNISVGDLLTEAAYNEDIDCVNSPVIETPQRLQHFSVVCDSFDAAVAAHISKYQNNLSFQSNLSPHHISSIWDGDETCDAFSFQKTAAAAAAASSSSSSSSSQKQALSPLGSIPSEAKEQTGRTSSEDGPAEVYEVEAAMETPVPTDPVVECPSSDQDILKNPVKDFSGLTDMYWPESLGPLDLDLRCTNYHTEEVILSDSLSCLNRLIASSLDAFQSCSFFGADKKEAAEAKGENASVRISSGV